jgi:hypothetical protein
MFVLGKQNGTVLNVPKLSASPSGKIRFEAEGIPGSHPQSPRRCALKRLARVLEMSRLSYLNHKAAAHT